MARVYLTSGTTWTVPADCTLINWVDCIGAGSDGGSTDGGGGGAYARRANVSVTPSAIIDIRVGLLIDTIFGGTTLGACTCGAKAASGTTGGTAAASVGDVKYDGGNGNATFGSAGGAGGPGGAGNNASATYIGGSGGAGLGGAGGTANNPGGAGTEYDATHGSGGGAGGRNAAGDGVAGGAYGGGGGGYVTGAGGAGAQGLIVIDYTPAAVGTLAATEAQDVAAIVGTTAVSGTLAATEAQDTAALAGTVTVSGILAATEAQDTAAFVVGIGFFGTLSATEAQDTASVIAVGIVSGSLSATDAQDVALFIADGANPEPAPEVIRMTLLEMVQQSCYEMGIVPPSVLVGNNEPQALQLYGLANRELKEQQQNREWTGLQSEWTIHISEPSILTGNLTSGSAEITNITNTTGIVAGAWVVMGENIPVAARVLSVQSLTQITMSEQATETVAGVSLTFAKDTYNIPPDFDRYQNRTMWDRTNRWELIGPDSPQFDQWHRSGIVTVGPRRHWRQIGTLPVAFRIWPPPAASDTPIDLVFEYISLNCVIAEDGTTYKQKFTADSDITILDEHAIILGLKWRYLQAKGLSYAAQQEEYDEYVGRRQASDGGAATLNMGRQIDNPFLSPGNVQDGFFPSGGSGS